MVKRLEIKGKGLSVEYDEKMIIEDLSFELNKSEITTIIGPNGCGKSTLLKTITRILNSLKVLSRKKLFCFHNNFSNF